jgi:hypothetical protein
VATGVQPVKHGRRHVSPRLTAELTYRGRHADRPLPARRRLHGSFYETPDALRRGLGLSDHAFDRFIAKHADIRASYVAESSR